MTDEDAAQLDRMFGEGEWVRHDGCPAAVDAGQPYAHHHKDFHEKGRPIMGSRDWDTGEKSGRCWECGGNGCAVCNEYPDNEESDEEPYVFSNSYILRLTVDGRLSEDEKAEIRREAQMAVAGVLCESNGGYSGDVLLRFLEPPSNCDVAPMPEPLYDEDGSRIAAALARHHRRGDAS